MIPQKKIFILMDVNVKYYNFLNCGRYLLMNCFGDKTTGYGTGTKLTEYTYRDVEGSLKNRGLITWFNKARLKELFQGIGFQMAYTEELTVKYNKVVTERLITCLKKPS